MKMIPLLPKKANKVSLIDDDDYERVAQYHWLVRKRERRGVFYGFDAVRSFWLSGPHPKNGKVFSYSRKGKLYNMNGHYERIFLHRFILHAPEGMIVDHIDGNSLNNQKSNLRLCSTSQNNMNSKLRKSSNSGFRGVTWDTQTNKWRATITQNHKMKNLGRFTELKDAILARQQAEKEAFGDFARLM